MNLSFCFCLFKCVGVNANCFLSNKFKVWSIFYTIVLNVNISQNVIISERNTRLNKQILKVLKKVLKEVLKYISEYLVLNYIFKMYLVLGT